jgi:hypothetical protein
VVRRGHLAHTLAPALPAKVFLGQRVQGLVLPALALYDPGEQGCGRAEPAAGHTVPAGQGLHAVAPRTFWNLPAGQLAHTPAEFL